MVVIAVHTPCYDDHFVFLVENLGYLAQICGAACLVEGPSEDNEMEWGSQQCIYILSHTNWVQTQKIKYQMINYQGITKPNTKCKQKVLNSTFILFLIMTLPFKPCWTPDANRTSSGFWNNIRISVALLWHFSLLRWFSSAGLGWLPKMFTYIS